MPEGVGEAPSSGMEKQQGEHGTVRGPRAFLVGGSEPLAHAAASIERSFEVRSIASGSAALDAIQGEPPDLLIVDIATADLDGFEVCRRIRERPECRRVPLLMLVALDDEEAMELAFEAGATDLVLKPICERRLQQRVRCAIQASRQHGRLRVAEAKSRALLEAVPGVVLRVARNGRVIEAERGRLGGGRWAASEFVSRGLEDLFPEQAEALRRAIVDVVNGLHESRVLPLRLGPVGAGRDFEVRLTPCGDEHVLAVFEEVGGSLLAERLDRRDRDDLTGLPSRAFFLEIVTRALHASRRDDKPLATLIVDIDGFKSINDSLGHHVGDALLREAAVRMRDCLRSSDWLARTEKEFSDPPPARIGRLGGDEFCILLPGLSESSGAANVALRILNGLSEPFDCYGSEIRVTASIGIALSPEDSQNPEELLRHADAALHHAKERRTGGFEFYSMSIGRETARRLQIEVNLRRAIDRDEFELHYQPIVELSTGRILGAEALLRWNSDVLGEVPPAEFIPVAERTGLIAQIGDWVLERACSDAQEWQDLGVGEIPVSVNVSGVQFRRRPFGKVVQSILDRVGLDPKLLILELTETTLMHDLEPIASAMSDLRNGGTRLAVDDFGTGYSSLSYVRDLPIDTIKLDGSFLAGAPGKPQSAAIARAVHGLAGGLGLTLVAEGVETELQRDFLVELGYEVAQGYLFSRAVPHAQLMHALAPALSTATE